MSDTMNMVFVVPRGILKSFYGKVAVYGYRNDI
jgi:hypothetical protein